MHPVWNGSVSSFSTYIYIRSTMMIDIYCYIVEMDCVRMEHLPVLYGRNFLYGTGTVNKKTKNTKPLFYILHTGKEMK